MMLEPQQEEEEEEVPEEQFGDNLGMSTLNLIIWHSVIVLWTALFSWVLIFVDCAKITHSLGSQFMALAFSYIIHTENRFFVGTRFRGSDFSRKPRKLVPQEN